MSTSNHVSLYLLNLPRFFEYRGHRLFYLKFYCDEAKEGFVWRDRYGDKKCQESRAASCATKSKIWSPRKTLKFRKSFFSSLFRQNLPFLRLLRPVLCVGLLSCKKAFSVRQCVYVCLLPQFVVVVSLHLSKSNLNSKKS